ncbi:MAG TPA: hypothetical protein VG604_03910 [Candidatus Saccharimonadales bacterium]|nr:hypothetical protein [Candidatus Saccharimonadales bacterium]
MAKKPGSKTGKRSAKSRAAATKKSPADSKKPVRVPRKLEPKRHPRWQFWRRLPANQLPSKLPSSWRLTKLSAKTLRGHWKLFGKISLIYGVLNLALVRGFSSGIDIGSLRSSFDQAVGVSSGSFTSGIGTFVSLLGSASTSGNPGAGTYQLFLVLFVSLAVIWALRQVAADHPANARGAYYQGMYPLIPFILVTIVIGLQLIPLTIGSFIYSIVISNGIAVGFWEHAFWLAIFVLLAALSIRMICSSIFALYIVTLPDMTPMSALRSARRLVKHRRLSILRKLLWLPILLLIILAVILVPVIIWIDPITQWLFLLLIMCAPAAIHAYIYTLYRELLND